MLWQRYVRFVLQSAGGKSQISPNAWGKCIYVCKDRLEIKLFDSEGKKKAARKQINIGPKHTYENQ